MEETSGIERRDSYRDSWPFGRLELAQEPGIEGARSQGGRLGRNSPVNRSSVTRITPPTLQAWVTSCPISAVSGADRNRGMGDPPLGSANPSTGPLVGLPELDPEQILSFVS